jgi:hypothetical protein
VVERRYMMSGNRRRNPGFRRMDLSTQTSDEPLGIAAALWADRRGNNSRFSATKRPSSDASAEHHARIFGVSLAAVSAACLVLNVASPSTRVCQPSDRDFVTTGTNPISASSRVVAAPEGGSHAEPFETIRSKECATNEGREEPGY